MWDEKWAFIARHNGGDFAGHLFEYFNPEDLSRWVDEPVLNFIRSMRWHIIQASALAIRYADFPLKNPELNNIKDFDMSERLKLTTILEFIRIEFRSINASMSILASYWYTFLFNPEVQFLYTITTPLDILEETISKIKPSTLRIKKWAEYLINHPAIDAVPMLAASETVSFRYIVEVFIENVYVIEIVSATSEKFIELKKKEI
jgi:hypothetical protein